MAIAYRGLVAAAILSAQIVGAAVAQGLPPVGAPIVMNGQQRPDLALETGDQGGWSFRYERALRPDPGEWLNQDAPQIDMNWKGWEAHADKWRNGLFGRHLMFQLEFPCRVGSVSASAVVAHFADTATRLPFAPRFTGA